MHPFYDNAAGTAAHTVDDMLAGIERCMTASGCHRASDIAYMIAADIDLYRLTAGGDYDRAYREIRAKVSKLLKTLPVDQRVETGHGMTFADKKQIYYKNQAILDALRNSDLLQNLLRFDWPKRVAADKRRRAKMETERARLKIEAEHDQKIEALIASLSSSHYAAQDIALFVANKAGINTDSDNPDVQAVIKKLTKITLKYLQTHANMDNTLRADFCNKRMTSLYILWQRSDIINMLSDSEYADMTTKIISHLPEQEPEPETAAPEIEKAMCYLKEHGLNDFSANYFLSYLQKRDISGAMLSDLGQILSAEKPETDNKGDHTAMNTRKTHTKAYRAARNIAEETMMAFTETLKEHDITIPGAPLPHEDNRIPEADYGYLYETITADIMQFAAVYRRQLLREFRSGVDILPEQTMIAMREPLSFSKIGDNKPTQLIIMNSQIHPMDDIFRDEDAMADLPDGWVLCDVTICGSVCMSQPTKYKFCLIYIKDGKIHDDTDPIYLTDKQIQSDVWEQHKLHFKAHPELIEHSAVLSPKQKAKYLAELEK